MRRLSRHMLALVIAAAALPPTASAATIGLDVVKVDGDRVTGVQHCVPPELAGTMAEFVLVPGYAGPQLAPGMRVGAEVNYDVQPFQLVSVMPTPPCPLGPPPPMQPTPPPPPPTGPGPMGPVPMGTAPTGPGPVGTGPVAPGGEFRFSAGFLSRVWKFEAEADNYENGRLSITIDKVLNVPKRFSDQDDELVDQDALVLIGRTTKVKGDLDKAESVRVHGKLLRQSKWLKDEDGEPVATIRAKKVVVKD